MDIRNFFQENPTRVSIPTGVPSRVMRTEENVCEDPVAVSASSVVIPEPPSEDPS